MVVRGSAWEAASWRSRSGTPASSAAVMNACRRVCGLIFLSRPARRATRRTIRLAQWRSMRWPSGRRKIGPSTRSPIARSRLRAVRGASGMVTILPPLRSTVSVRCPRSLRIAVMSAPSASVIRSPFNARRVLLCRTEARGHEQRAEFVAIRSEEHTSELQSLTNLVCRLLLEKKNKADERNDELVDKGTRIEAEILYRKMHHDREEARVWQISMFRESDITSTETVSVLARVLH